MTGEKYRTAMFLLPAAQDTVIIQYYLYNFQLVLDNLGLDL